MTLTCITLSKATGNQSIPLYVQEVANHVFLVDPDEEPITNHLLVIECTFTPDIAKSKADDVTTPGDAKGMKLMVLNRNKLKIQAFHHSTGKVARHRSSKFKVLDCL